MLKKGNSLVCLKGIHSAVIQSVYIDKDTLGEEPPGATEVVISAE